MANFLPIKKYQVWLINKCLNNYPDIRPPFLEIGCGAGFFLKFLESKKFYGKGIDISPSSIKIARKLGLEKIEIEQKNIFEEEHEYNFILIVDVLEHIENDIKCLEKIYDLLNENSYLILQVPSHKRKYCWIDAQYGHYRRYDRKDLIELLKKANLKILKLYCVGFPFFSLTEDFFSLIGRYFFKQRVNKEDLTQRTSKSGIISPVAERFSVTNILFNKILDITPLWEILYRILDLFLNTDLGSTYFIVCKKG